MTVNREALLRRENEYLTKKIKEELSTWRKNNYESAKHTVISIVISSLALVFGGSLTLYGSLASLKNLFKEVNENAEEFKNTMETFKSLYQNTEPQQESSVKVIEEHLEDYYKDQKKVFEFLEGLNKHMHHMLICRSITVTITSLVVLMLAIVSIFYLIINSENDIFEIIDILLICFSAIILYHSICVMICIQLIIPHITEHMFEKRRDKEKKKKEAAEKGSVQDEQQLKVQNQQQLNVQDEQQLKVQDQLQFKVQDQQQLKIQDKQLLKMEKVVS
ncbi:hypothetical protein F8M41_003650 [Gigaspora margarita]|uniref:Uncharacterized protein n=1 Tax=Gigaspora margarita TaxID=4874 RepID=A0A8H4A7A8_GIGMA|nr:hypothetical protein F8M41_003650 [Gigaspora margarita]